MIDKQQNSGQKSNDATTVRKQAEEQARTIEPIALSAQTPEEIEQLIHELQLHQIELEIQNEELRTAQALTESKKVEDAQRESEEHFRSAFEHSAIGMALVSPEGKWLKVNNLVAKIVGYTADELMGKTFQEITHPEDLYTDLDFVRQMLAGEIETYQMEKRYIHKDGHIVWGLLAVSLIRDKLGTPRHFISQIQDITELKLVEEALRKSEALLNATQSLSKIGGWEWNVETQTLYWTEETYRIHDFTPGEMDPGSATLINQSVECYEPEARLVILAAFQHCVEEGQPYDLELPFMTATGRQLWIRTTARPVRESGKVIRVIGNIIDITDRKHREQQLAAALIEKEVLLREVHHRVKNNLAAIIGLMDMQRRTLEDSNGQIILTELSNRIRSMSLVHEKLYRAESLAHIDFHEYIQALVSHLRTSFGARQIICEVDAQRVEMPLDLAMPCGLIINELITNALKYAFPDGQPRPGNTDCRVLVRLHRDKGTYTLTVADNGIGWPAEFDWTKTKTLGLNLVRMLGQYQLGGHCVVDRENGTSITLTFTDRKKEAPVHG